MLFAISGRPIASAWLLGSSAWDSGSANWCWCIGCICRFPSPSPPNRFCTFNYFKEFLAVIRSICCYFTGSLDVIGAGLSCWWWNEPSRGNAVSSPASSSTASGPRSICSKDLFRISPLYLGLVFDSISRILTGEGLEPWGEGLPPSAPPKSGLRNVSTCPGLATLAAFWFDE